MGVSRRYFVFGSGAVVTAAFAKQASSYSERTGSALLIPPDSVTGELHIYEGGILTWGPWSDNTEVTPLTWREYLVQHLGVVIRPGTDLERVCHDYRLEPEEFDEPMHERNWDEAWEIHVGPAAQAYHRLKALGLGPGSRPGPERGWIEGLQFIDSGFHPGDSSYVVESADPVVVALLQARLIELGTGLRIVPGH